LDSGKSAFLSSNTIRKPIQDSRPVIRPSVMWLRNRLSKIIIFRLILVISSVVWLWFLLLVNIFFIFLFFAFFKFGIGNVVLAIYGTNGMVALPMELI